MSEKLKQPIDAEIASGLHISMQLLEENSVNSIVCIKTIADILQEYLGLDDNQKEWLVRFAVNSHGLFTNASQCRQWFESRDIEKGNRNSKLEKLLQATSNKPAK